MKVLRVDSINITVARQDGEEAAFAHLYASHMNTCCFQFFWDNGQYPVARLETFDLLLSHFVTAREAFLRPVGSTMVSPSSGRDGKRFELPWLDTCQISYTQGIKSMGFLHAKPSTVPPCSPTCPSADGQAKAA